MTRRRTCVLATAAATAALVAAGVAGGASASADPADRDLINKTDGSRLATYSDSQGEGAPAISLRSPAWKYRSEAWRAEGPGWDSGSKTSTRVFRNVAANKCLQPATAKSERGTKVVIKTCDGSDLQKWIGHPERTGGSNTGWWMWTPKTNKDLALTLDRYNDGSWNTLHLETAYPSSDRLWRVAPDDKPWNL